MHDDRSRGRRREQYPPFAVACVITSLGLVLIAAVIARALLLVRVVSWILLAASLPLLVFSLARLWRQRS